MRNHPVPQALAGLAFALAALLLFAPPAAAQPEGSALATIDVEAEIVEGLTLTPSSALNFGQIVAASAGNTKTASVAKGSADAGKITAAGTGSNQIAVSYTMPGDMSDGSGNAMDLALTLYGNATDDGSTATAINNDETVSLSSGNYYFYLTGDLTVGDASANPAGTYDTDFTLEIEYTSN